MTDARTELVECGRLPVRADGRVDLYQVEWLLRDLAHTRDRIAVLRRLLAHDPRTPGRRLIVERGAYRPDTPGPALPSSGPLAARDRALLRIEAPRLVDGAEIFDLVVSTAAAYTPLGLEALMRIGQARLAGARHWPDPVEATAESAAP